MGVQNIWSDLVYWERPDAPDPFEAIEIINGTHAGVKNCPSEILDMREAGTHFNLDQHAFQIVNHKFPFLSPANSGLINLEPQDIKNTYWPELFKFLKLELQARSVLMLENVIRASSNEEHAEFRDKEGRPIDGVPGVKAKTVGKPFHIVHNDFSPIGARNLLRAVRPTFFDENGCADSADTRSKFAKLREEIISSEQEAIGAKGAVNHKEWDGSNYTGPRWALFSVWRPLDTVEGDPLSVLDPNSLIDVPCDYATKCKSFVSIDLPHKDRKGLDDYVGANIMPLAPSADKKHRWYYQSKQKPEEVLLVKLFDSEAWKDESRVMPFCAHSAFRLPDQQGKPARRSIETRCLVIW